MSNDLVAQVQTEVERIESLSLEEQPTAFSALRDRLEGTLSSADTAVQAGN